MKQIIATEQIFSPMGHRTGVRYWYADGTKSTVYDRDRKIDIGKNFSYNKKNILQKGNK
jgi:hypothetical protein